MTKEEQNNIIKRVWTEHLQRKDDIPIDLADGYSIWLRNVIRQASHLLTPNTNEEGMPPEGGPEGMPPEGGPEGMSSPPNVEATQEAAGGM